MNSPAPNILICDDDAELAQLLGEYLQRNGMQTEWVETAEAAVARLNSPQTLPDALVLDIMLPGIDGLTALKYIRREFSLPILMLSARGEPIDRVVGLELGADDYLSKPCLPRELLARLQALLRRMRPASNEQQEIVVGSLRIRPHERRAWVNDTELDMTSAEFSVLQELVLNAGKIVAREQLTEKGLHRPLERFDRAINVHVSRLRQKLSATGQPTPEINAIRGTGYLMRWRGG
ncbi:MAG: response regulator transcription factor [Steroidobacteraceae bacterium]